MTKLINNPIKISKKELFTINCHMMYDNPEYEGSDEIEFYLGQASQNTHPLHFQSDWIMRDRLWYVPADTMRSIWLLKVIADENKVTFADLCLYALNYPITAYEKKNKKPSRKSVPLKYDTNISELEYSDELKLLAKIIFPERKGFALGLLSSNCIESEPEDFLAEAYTSISKPKKLIQRYENLTYNTAVTLDCYGLILHTTLYNSLVENYYYNFKEYKKYSAKLKKSLQEFANTKISQEFKCFDVQKMQKKLLDVV